jgi:hypothetical protein
MIIILSSLAKIRGVVHAVALLVDSSWYKLEGHEFDSRLSNFIFIWPNQMSCTMGLQSIHVTKISTKNHPEGKWQQARQPYNLAAICEPIF